MPAALPGRIECPAVMSQWVHSSQRSEIAAGESTRSCGLGLQSAAYCCNPKKKKKIEERLSNKGKTEWTWEHQTSSRSRRRRQVGTKESRQTTRDEKIGMEWGWRKFNFPSSSFFNFHLDSICESFCILYESCAVLDIAGVL